MRIRSGSWGHIRQLRRIRDVILPAFLLHPSYLAASIHFKICLIVPWFD